MEIINDINVTVSWNIKKIVEINANSFFIAS